MADFYEALKIHHSADDLEIRRAYRRLARETHPDSHPGISGKALDEAEARMALLNEARQTLSDHESRASYDREIGVDSLRVAAAARWAAPPVPRGFHLFTTGVGTLYGVRYLGNPEFDFHRVLDARFEALSLLARGGDFSGLDALASNKLWALRANSLPVPDQQLSHLSRFTTLTRLELGDTEITDAAIVHLVPLRNLAELDLWGTRITDESLRVIGQFKNLKNLSLTDTAVTDEGLAHLSQLVLLDTLNLRDTQVHGPGLRYLHGLKELDWLALSRVDRDSKRAIKRALPGLEIL